MYTNVHSVHIELKSIGLVVSWNDRADQSSLRDRLPIKARQRDAAIREYSTSLQWQKILSSAVNYTVLSLLNIYIKIAIALKQFLQNNAVKRKQSPFPNLW